MYPAHIRYPRHYLLGVYHVKSGVSVLVACTPNCPQPTEVSAFHHCLLQMQKYPYQIHWHTQYHSNFQQHVRSIRACLWPADLTVLLRPLRFQLFYSACFGCHCGPPTRSYQLETFLRYCLDLDLSHFTSTESPASMNFELYNRQFLQSFQSSLLMVHII